MEPSRQTSDESPPAPRPSFFSRLIGIFISPGATVASLGPKPPWIVPFLLSMIVTGTCAWLYAPIAMQDQMEIARKRGLEIPPQQQEMMKSESGRQLVSVSISVSTGVFTGVMGLVAAGIFFLIFQVAGGGSGSFRQVLSVVSHASLIRLLGSPLTTAMILGKDSSWAQPTLRALVPWIGSDTYLAKLLIWTNVFELWILGVIAVGIATVYRRSTASTAVIVFGVYFAIAAGVSTLW